MRIALIHAMRESMSPIEEAFARLWPAVELQNLLDESLATDLARSGVIDGSMTERFLDLGDYAVNCGAAALLFTCSAFGPCIEEVSARLAPRPVRRPTEGMIAEAAKVGGRVGLIASFAPTLTSLAAEFPSNMEIFPIFAEGALDALSRGDGNAHDCLVADAAAAAGDVDFFALAQFSIARAADAVAGRTGKTVLTTPDAAVRNLRRSLRAANR
jgi:hypothetical protein